MYSRFIGDRSTEKRDFGRIQKDRLEELKKWSEEVNRLRDKAKFAVVALIITMPALVLHLQTLLEDGWVKRSILGRVEAEKIVTHVFEDKERRRRAMIA